MSLPSQTPTSLANYLFPIFITAAASISPLFDPTKTTINARDKFTFFATGTLSFTPFYAPACAGTVTSSRTKRS